MRLIDADKLKEFYEPYKGLDVPCAVVCERIDSMPTIQPQGIDKDRLIEELEKEIQYWQTSIIGSKNFIEIGVIKGLQNAIYIINQQPTLPQPYKESE